MSTPEKIDLYKVHKDEYATPKVPTLVRVKKAKYLAIEGQGGPGGEEFTAKLGALYGVAYTIKMTRKFSGRGDYIVAKLEAQWWGEGGEADLSKVPPKQWRWRMMIRIPDFVGRADLEDAMAKLIDKGKEPEVREVEIVTLKEGLSVQMLHLGPYEKESETVAEMMKMAGSEGYEPQGFHHEIYLSDPRRVPPERLRTILRIPVRRRV